MKKFMIILDGVSGEPSDNLDNRTPLATANREEPDRWAARGRTGVLETESFGDAWSAPSVLAGLLGVRAAEAHALGRGPLEALAAGIDVPADRYIYRGNFITLDGTLLKDGLVRRVTDEETRSLIRDLDPVWRAEGFELHYLAPGRCLVVCPASRSDYPAGVPPYDLEGQDPGDFLPGGRKGQVIHRLLEVTGEFLGRSPVNEVRLDLGENPAGGLWLWGGGRPLKPAPDLDRQAPAGALFTQALFARGLAQWMGWKAIPMDPRLQAGDHEPPDFPVAELVNALRDTDRVAVFVEAPGESGRFGTAEDKVRAMNWYDQFILQPLGWLMDAYRPYRLVLASLDSQPTPVLAAGHGLGRDRTGRWEDEDCAGGSLGVVGASDIGKLIDR